MKNTNKKGFTIVELVIVIAVIAILAAVLIPTFASLTKKANLSADKQAITNMNKILAAEAVGTTFANPSDIIEILYAYGFNEGKLSTYSTDFHYAYDYANNKMFLVDDNDNVVYPEESVNKANLWGFYYDAVEGKIEGVTNYIAMRNITNAANFNQTFGSGTYKIDLNSHYVDLGEAGSASVTLTNGGFVSGNFTTEESVKTYTKLTAVTNNTDYSYVVFQGVKNHSGVKGSTFDNCIFYDSSIRFEEDLTISNCTFIGGIASNACIELYANNNGDFNISITNSEFNNVTRPINVSGGTAASNVRNITIEGCKFNGASDPKYLVQIADTDAKITIKNCQFNYLGNAAGAIRLHEDILGDTAFDYEAYVNANLTFSGNTFGKDISVDDYVETDGVTTDFAKNFDQVVTNKVK